MLYMCFLSDDKNKKRFVFTFDIIQCVSRVLHTFRQLLYSVGCNYYATVTDSLSCATSARQRQVHRLSPLITNPCSRQSFRTCHKSSVVPQNVQGDVRTNTRIDKRFANHPRDSPPIKNDDA